MALTFKNMWQHRCSCGRPPRSSSPSRRARHLGALPRHPPPHGARGRHAQVRRLLHVRDGLPGRVHLHRGRRAAREDHREVPDPLRDRPAALRLLRLLRRRLPRGGDHDEPRERPRGHDPRRARHRPRPAHRARASWRSTAPAIGPTSTTSGARFASPLWSGSRPSTASFRGCRSANQGRSDGGPHARSLLRGLAAVLGAPPGAPRSGPRAAAAAAAAGGGRLRWRRGRAGLPGAVEASDAGRARRRPAASSSTGSRRRPRK